ncbi:hypothetical protein RAA17_02425 [Komagataeibacter rhaeticus]|nr:hypothetical protein [Komagataeibacter rhaeticus]
MLPVAQVGGEVITTRLLARREGLGIRRAAASTICDLTIELLSQVTFTLLGLGLLFCLVNRSPLPTDLWKARVRRCCWGRCFWQPVPGRGLGGGKAAGAHRRPSGMGRGG